MQTSALRLAYRGLLTVSAGALVAAQLCAQTKSPASGPLRVSATVMFTLLEKRVDPAYPKPCNMCAHVSGTVVMSAVIGPTGRVEKARALSGPDILKRAAIDAVRQWRFRPYLLNGKAVAVETTITLPIDLQGD